MTKISKKQQRKKKRRELLNDVGNQCYIGQPDYTLLIAFLSLFVGSNRYER